MRPRGRAHLIVPLLLACSCVALPLKATPSDGITTPSVDLAALVPALLAALFLVTLVFFLAGCVCCTKNKFKQFTNTSGNDSELIGTVGTSCQLTATAPSPVDTGIVNPIADREFTIFGPLSPNNYGRRRGSDELPPDNQHGLVPPQFHIADVDNNNPTFEYNNNGPISPQELENIVNNNAENYIISEYENRNLNNSDNLENVGSPELPNIEELGYAQFENHDNWFQNSHDNFPRNQLQYLQEIGRGWFGRIVEAEAHISNLNVNYLNDTEFLGNKLNSSKLTKVAVKILDENVTVNDKCTFLDECKIYKNADNPHVLKLLGFNVEQDPWLMIFEYCSLGDLKSFLSSNIMSLTSLGEKGIPLKFQSEVASALSYLHAQNVIHSDIACHSCMVTENYVVKLGDYGGSKHQYPTDFYHIFDKLLPIRWLSPESWMRKPTKESNMWSFGVFLWESSSWGALPYNEFNDEEVISNVLQANGVRLVRPVLTNTYGLYLYQIMQSCWYENPLDRITAVQAESLLNYIHSNYFETQNVNKNEDVMMQNFDERWQNLKPNNIPKVDNSLNVKNISATNMNFSHLETDGETNVKFDTDSIFPASSECSADVVLEDFSEKTKSDSLTNLHGSLESIQERSVIGSDQSIQKNIKVCNESAFKKSTNSSGNCEVAPWLQDLPVTSQEDMSYMKTVSDVISDLDNMLSSEKTSSSESSHQTSPSRDMSNNTVSSTKQLSLDVVNNSKEYKVENEIFNTVDDNENALNIQSVSNLQNVPEKEALEEENKQDYPTLDFRLTKIDKKMDEAVHPIFQTKYFSNTQDYDSLQDSSYIPENENKTDSNGENVGFVRQCSSGSETEDEIWKKRIEMGTITEKIKMKSKSVTDFMVLTHIDMDFTDLESEDASYTSVDGKMTPLYFEKIKKKTINEYFQKDSSLPVEEYISFPKHFSFSVSNQNTNFNFSKINIIKLKKDLRSLTMRSLRPTKSLNDVSFIPNKNILCEDLQSFKVEMDTFLDSHKNESCNIEHLSLNENLVLSCHIDNESAMVKGDVLDSSSDKWETTKYMLLPEKLVASVTPIKQLNENEGHNNVELQSPVGFANIVEGNESNLFSPVNSNVSTSTPNTDNYICNTNDCNIQKTNNDILEAKNNISCEIKNNDVSRNKTYCISDEGSNGEMSKCSTGNYTVREIKQSSVETDVLNDKYCPEPQIADNESQVLLGPFSECTLDLYTGIKTEFKDEDMAVPEEEKYMFSSNFNDINTATKCDLGDNIPSREVPEVSAAYFFNSPAVPMNLRTNNENNIDYSLETWGRFLETTLENSASNNFDSIFPDADNKNDILRIPGETYENNVYQANSKSDSSSFVSPRDIILDIQQKEFSNLTAKLAEAENENNLNIELSLPLDVTDNILEDIHDNSNSSQFNQNENVGNMVERDIEEEHTMDDNMENIQRVFTAFSQHLESEAFNDIDENNMESDDVEFCERNSTMDYMIDPESVEALRTELKLKLPLAQMINQCVQDRDKIANEDDVEVNDSCENENETDNNKEIPSSINESQQTTQNEILIHYNLCGTIPLSPIQEESWSEFSDLIKVGEFEKSDTSNSLSLGQLNSSIIEEVAANAIETGEILGENVKLNTDEEVNDDSHGSNRTFVVFEGLESNLLNKKTSVSIDSLDGIDDQVDMDEEVEIASVEEKEKDIADYPLPNLPVSELISPYYDEHSNTKSTEEISQNVDHLLENITKTLENASKVGSVSSDCVLPPNDGDNDLSENLSFNNSLNSESKTYVIDNKNAHNDITYTCPTKVINVPDDVSNVSKISQPSLVSDLNTSNLSESQLKPSEKTISQNLHTKTPSMDSWCSNDTLFNVEENFDDICSFNDFTESPSKCEFDILKDALVSEDKIRNEDVVFSMRCEPKDKIDITKQPSIEMVMACSDNIHNIHSNIIYSPPELLPLSLEDDQISTTHIESPVPISSPKMKLAINFSDESHTSESNINNISDASISGQINTVLKRTNDNEENSVKSTDILVSADKENNVAVLNSSEGTSHENTALDSKNESDLLVKNPQAHIQTLSLPSECSSSNYICITSTPLNDHEFRQPERKIDAMSQDSIDSAQNLIDSQFEFLNNAVAPNHSIDEETSCYDFGVEFPADENDQQITDVFKNEPVINFVGIDHETFDYGKMSNITNDWLEAEKRYNEFSCDEWNKSNTESKLNILDDLSPIVINDDNSTSRNEIKNENLNSLTYADFQKSIEKKSQETDMLVVDDFLADRSLDIKSDFGSLTQELTDLNVKSKPHGIDNSNFDEKLQNVTPCECGDVCFDYATPKPSSVFSTGLSNIHFLGPVNDTTTSNPSYIDDSKIIEDINSRAPECLKDYDSGSDESNGNSSSSGEFTWKKGESEEPITLSASVCQTPILLNTKKGFSGHKCDVIKEEPIKSDSDSSEYSSDEEVEFVPSSWNYLAIPAKSALKIQSPDTSQSENKKKVAFKKQKHACVYEYPREVSDNEAVSPYLSDWQWFSNNNDADLQFGKYDDMCQNYYDSYYPTTYEPQNGDGDRFYVSPSRVPFDSFDLLNSSSQFFPGQHLSLLESFKSYDANGDDEIDNEPLPPLPPEILSTQPSNNSDDTNNVITTLIENSKTSDFITPDSGTVTPGSLSDYDIKNENEEEIENISTKDSNLKIVDQNSTAPSRHELKLNLMNKNRSSPNCGTLSISGGPLTPSTPSPSVSGSSSNSSSCSSPLVPSVLGGLRHTRDKLKLDLPPSPLARNSSSFGKTLNSDAKVFDFKNIEVLSSSDSKDISSDNSSCKTMLENNHIVEDIKDDVTSLKTESYVNEKSEEIVDEKVSEDLTESNHSVVEDNNEIKDNGSETEKWHSSVEALQDTTVLQKAVIPINMGDNSKKSILEPVKGEGTLLDSGDEDSGIGSSAYTTLERQIDVIDKTECSKNK